MWRTLSEKFAYILQYCTTLSTGKWIERIGLMLYGFRIVEIMRDKMNGKWSCTDSESGRIAGNHGMEFPSRLQENGDMGLAFKVLGACKGGLPILP